MSIVAENLLKEPEPVKQFCRVVKPLPGNRYQVRDESRRLFPVDATASWNVGDGVTVSRGWIVGSGTKFLNVKEYEV